MSSFVAVAGAAGDLGARIAIELRRRNVAVKALVRLGTAASRTQKLRDAGVSIVEVDMSDVPSILKAVTGATTVVSALQGLRDVMLGVQGRLLEASVAANVQRFIPSDFALDFTKTTPGSNRNLDLHREFHTKLDASGIRWTSVLNGGFMEFVVGGQMPIINDKWHRIIYFGNVDQKQDYTMIPDVAAYTAAVAADPNPTPKFLRIAGSSFNAKELAAIVTKVRGEQYKPMWIGSVGFLRGIISVLKFVIGGEDTKIMPPWQGIQYMENIFSGKGKLDPLDNDRYPDLKWTTVEKALTEADAERKMNKKSL
ncbi:hypothetical protein BOTCAL_0017g00200 [Botryotinia calthae]|uniref:NmrA-like domain-containing protein n=1 Tax=Botryotinia calthae TaxID=38488 RepID=A0A4Y8DHH9_9HELO|nr:hypothetical protein BOTCAL_0017g00200 [Botryotinia calthae]